MLLAISMLMVPMVSRDSRARAFGIAGGASVPPSISMFMSMSMVEDIFIVVCLEFVESTE